MASTGVIEPLNNFPASQTTSRIQTNHCYPDKLTTFQWCFDDDSELSVGQNTFEHTLICKDSSYIVRPCRIQYKSSSMQCIGMYGVVLSFTLPYSEI